MNETAMQNYQPVDLKYASVAQSQIKPIAECIDHSNEFEVNINDQSGSDSNEIKTGGKNIPLEVIYNEYNDIMKVHSTYLS